MKCIAHCTLNSAHMNDIIRSSSTGKVASFSGSLFPQQNKRKRIIKEKEKEKKKVNMTPYLTNLAFFLLIVCLYFANFDFFLTESYPQTGTFFSQNCEIWSRNYYFFIPWRQQLSTSFTLKRLFRHLTVKTMNIYI